MSTLDVTWSLVDTPPPPPPPTGDPDFPNGELLQQPDGYWFTVTYYYDSDGNYLFWYKTAADAPVIRVASIDVVWTLTVPRPTGDPDFPNGELLQQPDGYWFTVTYYYDDDGNYLFWYKTAADPPEGY